MTLVDLKQHPKWEATRKLGYNEFIYSVDLGPFNKYGAVRKSPHKHARYRERILNYETWDKAVSVYSNDIEYIDYLVRVYPVLTVRTPVSDEHSAALTDLNSKLEFRSKLYYGKYKYRLVVFRNYKGLVHWRNTGYTDTRVKECRKMLHDTFSDSDSRIQKTNDYMYAFFPRDNLPIIYTNNEGALMMFKLMCPDDFEVEITTVFIVD